jgi:hypothetical protein
VPERLCIPADEVHGVGAGELVPGKSAVDAARPQLFAEDGNGALAVLVHEGEGAPGRLRLRDRFQLDSEAAELDPGSAAELVRAERREE